MLSLLPERVLSLSLLFTDSTAGFGDTTLQHKKVKDTQKTKCLYQTLKKTTNKAKETLLEM